MQKNKPFSYCFRVYDYEQYLHDVGELRAMGYVIKDSYNELMLKDTSMRLLWLHIDFAGTDDAPLVHLHSHNYLAERVPNLEYIINELPVIKTISSKAV